MARKESKLRPSMSWAEIELAIVGMDAFIKQAIVTGKVTQQVFSMIQVKEYLETFKPAVPTNMITKDKLVELMAQYGISASVDTEVSQEIDSPLKTVIDTTAVSQDTKVLDYTTMTDDQRFDYLKMVPEKQYSPDDKVFMLNVGTMIMMKRAMSKPVKEDDL